MKSYLTGLLVFLRLTLLSAQDESVGLEKVILPPSPTAAELGKYGQYPVGMFTGASAYSIPLFELRGRDLSLPISLSYSSNGVRVDQIASWVGLSWSLNAGGVITRTVMGQPDESNHDFLPEDLKQMDPYEKMLYVTSYADSEPDVYAFNFMGHTGSFVQSKVDYKFYTAPHSNLLIEMVESRKFKITDEAGIQYFFDKTESARSENRCNDEEQSRYRVTAWYLTKVLHPTGDEIIFTYRANNYSYYTGIVESHWVKRKELLCPDCNGFPSHPDGCKNFISGGTLILDSIYNDNIVINFSSSEHDRLDSFGGKLDRITVRDRESRGQIKSYIFKYTFASKDSPPTGSNSWDKQLYYRMFLSEVREVGKDGKNLPPFAFEYIEMNDLPPRLSTSQDHWGFYNGVSNRYFTPILGNESMGTGFSGRAEDAFPHLASVDREAHFPEAQSGMLSKITYPTGGETAIDYEPNTSTNPLFLLGGGVRVARVSSIAHPRERPVVERYYYEQPCGESEPEYLSFTFATLTEECSIPGITNYMCIYPTMRSNSCRNVYVVGGSAVTYGKVTKGFGENLENGSEEYYYTCSADSPGEMIIGMGINDDGFPPDNHIYNKSAEDAAPYINYSWNTGQLIKKRVLGLNGVRKYEEEYDNTGIFGSGSWGFSGTEDSRNSKNVIAYNIRQRYSPPDILGAGYMDYYCAPQDVTKTYHPCYQKQVGEMVLFKGYRQYDVIMYKFLSRWGYVRSKKVTQYDQNGQNPVVTQFNYQYENALHAQLTRQETVDSKGKPTVKKFYFPQDYGDVANFGALLNKHILDKAVDIRQYRDGQLIQGTQNAYNDLGQVTNVYEAEVSPSSNDITFNANNPYTFSHRIGYRYDPISNRLIEAQVERASSQVFIWSYRSALPVAKIENATFSQVSSAVSNLGDTFLSNLVNSSSQGSIQTGLASLRSELANDLPNSPVTTFTHNPGVGLKSLTDVNGQTTFFEFDNYSRLKFVKDHHGNIVKGHSYNLMPTSLAPVLEFSPNSLSFPYSESARTFRVESNLAWNLSTNDDWLSISPASGNGPATIQVTAAENMEFGWRYALITIHDKSGNHLPDQTLRLSQFGHPNYVQVSTNDFFFIARPESATLNITSDVSWSIINPVSWVTISRSSGTGSAAVTVNVAENTSFSERTGSFTVRDVSGHNSPDNIVTVVQHGKESYVTVTPTSLHFAAAAGSKTVQVSSNVSWSTSDTQPWISVTPVELNGNGTATIAVQQNSAANDRSGVVSFRDISGGGNVMDLLVTQAGLSDYITVEPTGFYLNSNNSTATFDIFSNLTSWSSRIIYQSGSDWLDDIYPRNGMGNQNDVEIYVTKFPPSGITWRAEVEVYNTSKGISTKLFVVLTN